MVIVSFCVVWCVGCEDAGMADGPSSRQRQQEMLRSHHKASTAIQLASILYSFALFIIISISIDSLLIRFIGLPRTLNQIGCPFNTLS